MRKLNKLISIMFILFFGLTSVNMGKVSGNNMTIVGEGDDYATQVLGDAWDMSQFTDISQYLNQSGQANLLTNIQVANGIYSAQSISFAAPTTLIFPGYKNALLTGKVGHQFPINANLYKCIYVAAKVNSGPPQNGAPDQMLFTWFENENLNGAGSAWGETIPGIVLSTDWQLFSANLSTWTKLAHGSTAWNKSPSGQWQGLQVSPTIQNTTYQIDWVRLTDCAPKTISIGWTGKGAVTVYIRPEGTTNDIKVINSITSNPIILDVQGFQAGKFTYFVKQGTTTLTSADFQVNDAPIVTFKSPSRTSGSDFYNSNQDDFHLEPTDVAFTQCISYRYDKGIIYADTPTVQNQPPASCQGGGYNDPEISFTQSTPIDTTQYRYLTFHMYTAGPYQNVPDGMISRVVWYWNNRCILVSSPISLDVGWHTYSLDLWDPIEGAVNDHSTTGCPNPPLTWQSTSPASQFRLKLNENITGQVMQQELDWVKLTKPDTIQSGGKYPIKINASKTLVNSQLSFFYTTDRSNPLQNVAVLSTSNTQVTIPPGRNHIYLPILKQNSNSDPNTMTFNWITNNIPAADYYICVKTQDDYNSTTYCSEAPVHVVP